jgi:hypothetical protein
VQKILGHTQIKITQRYAHLSQGTLIDAANVVPFAMDMPMVAMVKVGSSGLVLGLRKTNTLGDTIIHEASF